MNFNKHLNLEGRHAFLGASNYHWINYDIDKLSSSYLSMKAKEEGTRLHDFARQCIELGRKQLKNHDTVNMYINDAIGYKMTPEQVLYYSDNCFGTADSICFRKKFLRIHDLKTGVTPTHIEQLIIYAALFCLEFKVNPNEIQCELRIYQSGEIRTYEPTADEILAIMDKIIAFDKQIEKLKQEA